MRRPSPEERSLWREAMRGVRTRRAADDRAPLPHVAVAAPAEAREAMPTLAPAPPPTGTGLDRRNAQRLKRGQMAIAARLDLHGMTQAEAHRALRSFLLRCHEEERRTVLVITGKGTRDGEGVLRRAVPRWLDEPGLRPVVLAREEAQPRDGGGGAFYVLLRRKRSARTGLHESEQIE
jgi:DNA-nicking Smr family endonuclease